MIKTPPNIITPTCKHCGRLKREHVRRNRRRLGVGWFWAACKCCCRCPWDSTGEGPTEIKINGYSDGDIAADCAQCQTQSESQDGETRTWDGRFCRKDVCLFTPLSCSDFNTDFNIDTDYEMAMSASRVVYDENDELWHMIVECDNGDNTNSLLWEGTACLPIDVYDQIAGCSPGPSHQEIVEVA